VLGSPCAISPEAEEHILMSFANREASDGRYEALIAAEPSTIDGGTVRNDISTALVRFYRQIFGRGPEKATTYAFDAGYVTFLRDLLAPHERVLILGGRPDLVCEARETIREAEREELIAEVQRLTGRPVLHDSFQFQPERNLAIELFWIPTGSRNSTGPA
jgi:uncharacterized protein YbcI